MKECALYWTTYLKKQEDPDIIIGLFHSGAEGGIITDEYEEDASLRIAKEVSGFDLILYGHDHKKHIETIKIKTDMMSFAWILHLMHTSYAMLK